MITDTELRLKGTEILITNLGLVESERFIALIQRELFDYSSWSQDLFKGKSIRDIVSEAEIYQNNKSKT